ncbi:MAG TPA: K(+)-transporting ATPase subunit F [Bryobacteraceae bacterium]
MTGSEGFAMDYVVGGVAAILVFAYLLYALLKPEKF